MNSPVQAAPVIRAYADIQQDQTLQQSCDWLTCGLAVAGCAAACIDFRAPHASRAWVQRTQRATIASNSVANLWPPSMGSAIVAYAPKELCVIFSVRSGPSLFRSHCCVRQFALGFRNDAGLMCWLLESSP